MYEEQEPGISAKYVLRTRVYNQDLGLFYSVPSVGVVLGKGAARKRVCIHMYILPIYGYGEGTIRVKEVYMSFKG